MSEGTTFNNLVEGDEVERFLNRFVMTDAQIAKIKATDPALDTSRLPRNTNDVLDAVKEIWKEKGLITPAELQSELLQKYTSNPAVQQTIKELELSRNTPDFTTGFLGKEHAYDATGLAHLYAKTIGKPVAMIEGDFSNMGGTNEMFIAQLAKEQGIPVEAVNKREAEALTDRAVKVLSLGMVNDLQKTLPAGAHIIPIRTGGDEVRFLVEGISDPKKLAEVQNALHSGIEKRAAEMGLQDHTHLKAPTDETRNGFGAALAVRDMGSIKNPATLIKEMDAEIKIHKGDIGLARIGKIDKEMTELKIEVQIDNGQLAVPKGMNREQFVAAQVKKAQADVEKYAADLHARNPMHNTKLPQGTAGFKAYTDQALHDLNPSPIKSNAEPDALKTDSKGAARPAGVEPLASMNDRRMALLEEDFKKKGVKLTDAERTALGISVEGLTPRDPSSRTLAPKDLLLATEAYAKENAEFKASLNESDTRVQTALKKAGLSSIADVRPQAMSVSFHNLAGLNDALGHHNADLALRHMAEGIIENSLAKAGIPTTEPKPYEIAHHGGGNFTVVMKPGGVDAKGTPYFISEKTMQDVDRNVAQRVQDLNTSKVTDFLKENGVKVDGNLQAQLGNTTFAAIQDPKVREVKLDDGHVLATRMNGLAVVSEHTPIVASNDNFKGYELIGTLRNKTDAKMNSFRDAYVRKHGEKQTPQATAQQQDATAVTTEAGTAQPQNAGEPQAQNSGADVNVDKPDVEAPDVKVDAKDIPEVKSSKFISNIAKKGGVVSGFVMGTGAAVVSLTEGATPAEAAELAAETAIPYGETGIELAKGNTEAAAKAAVVETASNVGGAGGATVGAFVGQALIPIPVLGAGIGAIIGGFICGYGSGAAAEKIIAMNDNEFEKLLKADKSTNPQDVALLQKEMIANKNSALPDKVKIGGRDEDIETALRQHPEELKQALKNSPEALKVIDKWEALEDHKKTLPSPQEIAIKAPVAQTRSNQHQPSVA